MTDSNKKRYVYLDKYLQYQDHVGKRLSSMGTRINLLTYVTVGMILVVTVVLYKIFG
jgi:hypothetical protein